MLTARNGSRSSSRFPVAVDIFAGCGGLSVGLERAGFEIASAIEVDERAAKAYATNHPATKVIVRDIREVDPRELVEPSTRIDLLAGCAPCQGFCSLTSKHERDDPRNELLIDMVRFIEVLRPTAILMENVPGLLHRGFEMFEAFVARLRAAGYLPMHAILQMADYGVPQNRRRLVLTAGRGFAIPLPQPTHARVPTAGRRAWRTVRDVLKNMPPPVTLRDAIRGGGPRDNRWHVVRNLRPQTRARLRAALPGQPWMNVDERLRPECHRGQYVGFTNVYGRMAWDSPSPTITSGCTTPAKGRFGHPDRRRTTISVREAAILQTFPRRYDFACEYIDDVCEMVGNAVPPAFAEVLGRSVRDAVMAHESIVGRQ